MALITAILAASLIGPPPILQARPRFYILAVGVKEYDYDKTGFGTLSGPRDAKLFVDGMKQWFGVDRSKGDVIEILDSPQQNTRAAIWAALERMAKNAKPDDAIVFFYSGHGTQVFDATKPTKQSQAIVPIDIRRKGGQAGDIIGESVITGPNFKTILAQLNAKKANNVTMFFDSCHSESISRGILRKKSGLPDAALANIESRGETNLEKSDETGWELSKSLAIFSATRAKWSAWEKGEKGFFTEALVNAMNSARKHGGPVSYATVFDMVRADVKAKAAAADVNQEPQFEGNPDRQLFSSSVVEQQPSYRVFVRRQSVKMEAGEVQGMREGMLFGLYPPTTMNFSSAPEFLARIEFLEIDNETSISSLEIVDAKGDRRVMPDKSGLNRYRAVLIDGLPGGKVKVLLDAEVSGAASALLKDAKFMELVEKGKPYDLLVSAPGRSLTQLVNPSTGAWNISNAAGRVIASIEGESEANLVDRIKASALNEAKRKTVLEIGPSGVSQVQVEAELVPAVTVAKKGTRGGRTGQELEATKTFQSTGVKSMALKTQEKPDENQEYRESFVIRLRTVQKGAKVAYVPYITLLDITAKGDVTVLWPRPNTTNMERTLLPADGEWHYLGNDGIVDGKNPAHVYGMYVDSVKDGSGVEILKIIATERPENFRPLLTSGRSRSTEKSAAMKSPLARLLGSLWEGDPESSTARAGGNTAGASSNWAVAQLDLFVDIKP